MMPSVEDNGLDAAVEYARSVADQLGPKTSRAHAEAELDELRQRLAERPTPRAVADVRVRSTVRVLNREWLEISLQIRLAEGMAWLDVLNRDHPLLVSRSEGSLTRHPEQYVEAVIRRFLVIDAPLVYSIGKWEARVGNGSTEYRCWLSLAAPLGVAVRTRPDGMLNLYGLR